MPRPVSADVRPTRPTEAQRLPCTCLPDTRKARTKVLPCAACQAWDKHIVLLRDGTRVSRPAWLQAQLPNEEESI